MYDLGGGLEGVLVNNPNSDNGHHETSPRTGLSTYICKKKTPGLSPPANYTDRPTERTQFVGEVSANFSG
jgi:hypothetical protein